MKPTAIQSRIDRLEARVRCSVCPSTVASIVHAMTKELDPEAIPALVRLLDHQHDDEDSVSRALLRYGEHAADSLRAAPEGCRVSARRLLGRLALHDRLLQAGCF